MSQGAFGGHQTQTIWQILTLPPALPRYENFRIAAGQVPPGKSAGRGRHGGGGGAPEGGQQLAHPLPGRVDRGRGRGDD